MAFHNKPLTTKKQITAKAYREKNREKMRAYLKDYYERVTREKMGHKKDGRKKVTETERQYVLNNYKQKTAGVLMQELGITRNRVKAIIKSLGISTVTNKVKPQRKKTVFKDIEKQKLAGFKGGKNNPNQYKDGEIIIRKDKCGRNQKYIRLPNKHYQNRIIRLAVYNWVKVNGEVPKGHRIDFKDRDAMNCEVENLECITRGEAVTRAAILLSDNFVKSKIKLPIGDIITSDEIEIKRLQLLINREIKKQRNGGH